MFLLHAHSGFRYLVYLAGLAALIYAVYGALRRQPYDRTMARLSTAFAGVLHLQILMGIGLLFMGRFSMAVSGHFLLMIFAAASAQVVPSVMRRRKPEERSYLPHVVGTAAALAFIVVGILAMGRPIFGSVAG